MTTITSGVLFGGGVILSPASSPSVIQSGLLINLQNAPTSGGTWVNKTGGLNTTITGYANVSYVSQYNGGVRIPITARNISFFDTGFGAGSIGNTYTISMTVAFDQTAQYWATWWGDDYYSNNQGYFAYQSGSTSLTVGSTTGTTSILFSTIGANIANVNVWDFTLSGTSLSYFLNGSWKGSATIIAPSSGTGTANIFFASRHPNTGGNVVTDNATGTYYSMRVYNRALSNAEVQTNYVTLKQIHGLP